MADDGWIECTLADACGSIDYGLTASATSGPAGPKFLRITDIVSGQIDWKSVPHVTADLATAGKHELYDGDVVIARTGASTGASAYVKNPPPAVFASYLVRLRAKPNFDSRFLAYYLKSERFWAFIRGVLGDKSAQPNASASTMTRAPLSAPSSKEEQRAIAHVLGTLDDKIELNRRMNETLEAIADALFKSWFVDFDPVRAKAEGRDTGLPPEIDALFSDGFEETEIGDVPKGWEVRPLDEVADFLNGLALQKFPPTGTDDLPVIKIAELRSGVTPSSDWANSSIPPEYVIRDGDVLFSWSGSLEVVLWSGGTGALNQHLFKVTSKAFPKWFYYFWTRTHLPEFRFIASNKATTMGHINRGHLTGAQVFCPPEALVNAADRVLAPMFDRLLRARWEIRALAALLGTLLPKLVSGEIRLEDPQRLLRGGI